jgi:hypothetical protein
MQKREFALENLATIAYLGEIPIWLFLGKACPLLEFSILP